MRLTLNVLEDHTKDRDRHWPGYLLGGRIRTSTVVLIVAFCAVWWAYDHYRPPTKSTAPPAQVVPPGFVPDPDYTWVPRTRVQPPPTYYTPTRKPTSTMPTTTPPTTTTTTTTPPPLFQLPALPPPFGPGTTTSGPPGTSGSASPGPSPSPAPLPALPGFGR